MKSTNPYILAINGGSSSIKFALFEFKVGLHLILKGEVDRIGQSDTSFKVKGIDPPDNFSRSAGQNKTEAEEVIDWITERFGKDPLAAVGHRVVHGGPNYSKPEIITPKILEDLQLLSPFDPEHLPREIQLIEAFDQRFSKLPQVACFDTAFYHSLPTVARLIPLPRRYEAKGLRRYGFHGLSYEFLMKQLSRLGSKTANGNIILAHLGNGASLTAVKNGVAIDTSMSFTPTAGVPMGTRSGDLDPGIVWYLSQTEGLDAKGFNEMVTTQSGLIGMSEVSSDMRKLLEKESQDAKIADAIAVFCYQTKKYIGAFAAALGGLNTLVFSGGIGENAPSIRARICKELDFLGVKLEEEQNIANAHIISTKSSPVTVHVIPTDEEWMIAHHVCQILGLS